MDDLDGRELMLECQACGHWTSGPFDHALVLDWFRTHREAQVSTQRCPPYGFVRRSTCPEPCGVEEPNDG